MARNNKGNQSSDFGDGKPKPRAKGLGHDIKHWLSPYLDDKDRGWLEDNRDNISGFIFGVLSELPDGYDFSSKFDDRTDRWLATLKCVRDGDANYGIAVTGRGSTRTNSIYTCLYIASEKLEWNWLEGVTDQKGDFG
jgi:hypothetical protein